MSINLDELSVDELEKLIKQAESALDKKRKAELKNAQAVLEKMAKDLGVSPEALLKDTAGKKKATRKKATKKKASGVRCGCRAHWRRAPSWKISLYKSQRLSADKAQKKRTFGFAFFMCHHSVE